MKHDNQCYVLPGERYFLAQTKTAWIIGDVVSVAPVQLKYRGNHCFEVCYICTESSLVDKNVQYSKPLVMVGRNKEIRKRFANKIGRWPA